MKRTTRRKTTYRKATHTKHRPKTVRKPSRGLSYLKAILSKVYRGEKLSVIETNYLAAIRRKALLAKGYAP